MIRYVTKSCLFCGSDACLRDLYPRNFRDEDLHAGVFSARRVTEHFHYRMVRCARTGLVFSREILPEEELGRLYAGSKVTFGRYAGIIRKDYWRPLEPFLETAARGRALEVGCSSGFFLEELLERGFQDVAGCEPSLEAKAMAPDPVRNRIRTGFFADLAFPDAAFDLVCCFQTLDHLSDPLAMLGTCRRKLKPGGLLYIIVHDVDSLQARLFGDRSPIIDVEHVYLFNRRTLALAVEQAGFRALETFPIRNSYPLEYWIDHAPLPGKGLLRAALRALRLDQARLPLRLGNIGILARKP